MSDHYGWRIYEPDGVTVRSDDSVIMAKRLGSYEIPLGYSFQETIIPVDFQGGIPFAFVCGPKNLSTLPESVAAATVPNVMCTHSSVIISFNQRQLSYPDDLGYPKAWGGLVVHWGVYFADAESGGIYN